MSPTLRRSKKKPKKISITDLPVPPSLDLQSPLSDIDSSRFSPPPLLSEEILSRPPIPNEPDTSLGDEIGSCIWLTPYGTEFRYPGAYPEVNHETAEKAFNDATLVKNAVLERLKEYLLKEKPEEK